MVIGAMAELDWQVILLALIGISSAPLMAMITQSYRRAERQEDYRREDEVAERVRIVSDRAEDVSQKVDRTASDLVQANRSVASTVAETAAQMRHSSNQFNTKLDVIHTLVNSTLTAALQGELTAFIGLLALMRNPGAVDNAELLATEHKIMNLKRIIRDRDQQAKLSDLRAADNAEEEG